MLTWYVLFYLDDNLFLSKSQRSIFIMAPILQIPSQLYQFVIKVDRSDSGMGAVLSQRLVKEQKRHPCAFSSRHHIQTKPNHNIDNTELLKVIWPSKSGATG